ncbi:MAG: translation initiation factor IF-2 [Actinomycetota bacterium]|nr:translation initiation factor IF-2 [Actinomycetota bacterium]
MAKPRVHEVAKELGLTSKEVLAHLEKIGNPVKSHSSTIDESVAERVRSDLGDGAAPAAKKAPPKAQKPAAAKPAPAPPAKAPSAKAKPAKAKPAKAKPATPAAKQPAPAPQQEPVADPATAPEPAAVKEPEPGPTEPAAPPEEQPAEPPAPAAVTVHRGITVQDFADRIDRSPPEIVKALLGLGEMVTVTQSMSDEAVLLVAEELGVSVQIVDPELEEAEAAPPEELEDEKLLSPRPPVVTVMGHVDHGKTSILDSIRQTNVVGGEAGGITQHIGAYRVAHDGREVTFIDTPGHEAFTAMRARGAQVTDLAVLVVAADDGVMPQTVEAIDHAQAAGVPIVVAVNKIDRPEADPSRVRQQLSDRGLLPEEWGGDTVFVDVSAKQRTNLDQLLEMILLTADVRLDLKANPNAPARGHVIEAHLDKGRGPVATVLILRGTLVQGDAVLAGVAWGRVRAMLDERGKKVTQARPGQPVQILGWQAVPEAGDEFRVEVSEKEARRITSEREQHRRAAELVSQRATSLMELLAQTQEGEIPELNLLAKADAQGSVEALEDQLAKLDQTLVKINILRSGAGAITENDVTLAQASNAIVIGFNVVPTAQARALAEENGVDVRTYRVIYQAVQDIENAARGLLGPETREVSLGRAEVRAIFRVPKAGVVAGCMVTDGIIRRNADIRLVRDGTVIYESKVGSLKRFKEDAREVAAGYECGIGIEGFQDVKEGDLIEAYEVQEVAR